MPSQIKSILQKLITPTTVISVFIFFLCILFFVYQLKLIQGTDAIPSSLAA
jgi:hypothetical protein